MPASAKSGKYGLEDNWFPTTLGAEGESRGSRRFGAVAVQPLAPQIQYDPKHTVMRVAGGHRREAVHSAIGVISSH